MRHRTVRLIVVMVVWGITMALACVAVMVSRLNGGLF